MKSQSVSIKILATVVLVLSGMLVATCVEAINLGDFIKIEESDSGSKPKLSKDQKLEQELKALNKELRGLVKKKASAENKIEKLNSKASSMPEGKKRDKMEGLIEKEQAKIKVILQDKRFSAVCVGMQNISLLTTNIDAVLNKTKLTQADRDALNEYARATCSNYCAGCAHICDSALPDAPFISDIMRYLMYYNSYGDRNRARELFAKIPGRIRSRLLNTDYTPAENHCPQHLPIAKLVAEAVSKLA